LLFYTILSLTGHHIETRQRLLPIDYDRLLNLELGMKYMDRLDKKKNNIILPTVKTVYKGP